MSRNARRIEARSAETSSARPEGREPDGKAGAPFPGIRSWPNRLLMEIECITDPDELEAACNLGLKRVALLRSGK